MGKEEMYTPIDGFYDLREFDIPNRVFTKLWKIQKFLYECEQNRRDGVYLHMKNELDKVRELSGNYQQILFSYNRRV